MSDAAPLMNNRIRLPADTCRLNAKIDLCGTGDQQVDAEGDGGDQDGYSRPRQHHDAEDQRQNPG